MLQSDVEFVRAVEDHDVKEATLLAFKKGDVIRVIRRKNTSKGKSRRDYRVFCLQISL